jgi:hypothetical protein
LNEIPESYFTAGYVPTNPNQQRPLQFRSEQLDFIQELLNKEELMKNIPPHFKLFTSAFIKNLAISNFTEKDIRYIVTAFDDIKTATIMAKPPSFFTWEDESVFTHLRPIVFTEACRAKEGQERKLLATSINQTYLQQDVRGMQSAGSGGIWNRMRKLFGRGY